MTMDEVAAPPDGMDRLWVPHRMAYIKGEKKPQDPSVESCPFCLVTPGPQASQDDADHLLIGRGRHCFAVLNLFPYNAGHVMVLPYRHVAAYIDLTDSETAELSAMTKMAIQALTAAYKPHGFNLGMNQGEVAGAGIAAHLHQHVVPRWQGDANFLPIVGQSKAMPEFLADTRSRLADAWPTHSRNV